VTDGACLKRLSAAAYFPATERDPAYGEKSPSRSSAQRITRTRRTVWILVRLKPFLLGRERRDLLTQRALFAFEGKDIISLHTFDLALFDGVPRAVAEI
jgi:hypothetical protein